MEYFKKNPREIEAIRGPIFENKVLQFVINKSKQTEKNITSKELYDIQEKTFKEAQ